MGDACLCDAVWHQSFVSVCVFVCVFSFCVNKSVNDHHLVTFYLIENLNLLGSELHSYLTTVDVCNTRYDDVYSQISSHRVNNSDAWSREKGPRRSFEEKEEKS